MNAITLTSLPAIHADPSTLLCKGKSLLTFSTLRPRLTSNSSSNFQLKRGKFFRFKIHASEPDLLGDYGARDPFPAEIESNFAEKVLGNVDTEHKILIPNLSALSLAKQKCSPVSPSLSPMSLEDAKMLLKKVLGWRLLEGQGGVLKLQCLWKVRDFNCGVELINRISKVTESEGHFPNVHVEDCTQVRAELWTASIGGLSMNDFIVAAKIDEIKTSDLAPRKRVWA